MNLNNQLKLHMDEIRETNPGFIVRKIEKYAESLKTEITLKNVIKEGDIFPDHSLLNHNGETVSLSELRMGKPVIISFYRGSWCPFCNLELRAYDTLLNQEENKDITMLAISPELPDKSLSSQEIDKLAFVTLSDVNNGLAHKLKLVFVPPWWYRLKLRLTGPGLKKSQGNSNGELPVPATYVVDKEGLIVKSWIDPDYRKRGEPAEVLKAVRSLL